MSYYSQIQITSILIILLGLIGFIVPTGLAAPASQTPSISSTAIPSASLTLITDTLVTETTSLCQESYIIQSGDNISKIAQFFYGETRLFNLIISATSLAAEEDSNYSPIADINNLEVGQRLCIPDSDDASILVRDESDNILEVDENGQIIIPSPIPVPNPGAIILIDKITEFPTGKAILLVENFSPAEIIIDLIGPNSQTQQIPAGDSYNFVLDPGIHKFNAHAPQGVVTLPPGILEIKKDQIIHLVTFANNYEQNMLNRTDLDIAKTSAPRPTAISTSAGASFSSSELSASATVTTSSSSPFTSTVSATSPRNNSTGTPISRATASPTRTPRAAVTPTGTDDGKSVLAPPAGFSRIYLQNYFSESVKINIANQTVTIAPDELKTIDLDPGRYVFTISVSTGTGDGQLNLRANTSWIIRLKKDGGLGWVQIYP
ncbi:LysM domain-containing protein [Anaerolineales bacterium HSG6]|nr:LysM domain-containing protein [Anaerolineales bacterium HSG6]